MICNCLTEKDSWIACLNLDFTDFILISLIGDGKI